MWPISHHIEVELFMKSYAGAAELDFFIHHWFDYFFFWKKNREKEHERKKKFCPYVYSIPHKYILSSCRLVRHLELRFSRVVPIKLSHFSHLYKDEDKWLVDRRILDGFRPDIYQLGKYML